MADIYVFYADVFWLTNTLMNSVLLLLARLILGEKPPGRRGIGGDRECKIYGARLWRILAAAMGGGILEVILLVLLRSYGLYLVLSHVLVIPLMVFAVFGKAPVGLFLRRLLLCYVISVGFGGILPAVQNTFGWSQVSVLGVLAAAFLTLEAYQFWVKINRRQKQIYRLELKNGPVVVKCKGLLDSGNLLRAPCSDRPVHIISEKLWRELRLGEREFLGFIPYSALGKSEGNLAIYRLSELRIFEAGPSGAVGLSHSDMETERQSNSGAAAGKSSHPGMTPRRQPHFNRIVTHMQPYIITDAIVAKAQPGLLEKGDFQVILHGEVFCRLMYPLRGGP